jgi:hypothetical protein
MVWHSVNIHRPARKEKGRRKEGEKREKTGRR